jgi:hypothetical protein
LLDTLPIQLLPYLPQLLAGSPLADRLGEPNLAELILPLYDRRVEQDILAHVLAESAREHEAAPPKRVVLTPHAVSGALDCPVCLCQFACREPGVVRLKCGHVFHGECLVPWFREHHTCPVCRMDIDEVDN